MVNSIGKGFPSANIQIGHTFCDIDDLTLWKYIGGPPTNVSSWVLLSGRMNTQPDTSLWGVNQAGASWFYIPEGTYYGWNGSAIVLLAFGVGLNLYNPRIRFAVQDDFATGGQSSGNIGVFGWSSSGTILAASVNDVNRPGAVRLETGAVSGTQARINGPVSALFNSNLPHEITWIARLNTNDANTTIRIGAGNGVSADPPLAGIYFEKLDADVNWACVMRAGGVQTRVLSTVPVNQLFNTFKYVRNATDVLFYINGELVATITAASSSLISPYVFIINSAAANKTVTVDYFEMISDVSR